MTTRIFFTVDTELSYGSHKRGLDPAENLQRSIFGGAAGVGIDWQARQFARHGLKAVFFVDPMPAPLFGLDPIKRIVDAVLSQGQEVQLHLHTEWLDYLDAPPVAGPMRPCLANYDYDDQLRLIDFARDLLVASGAPLPIAFRAGSYGADDMTLKALATLGFRYDTSFNGAYTDVCRIGLPPEIQHPVAREGVLEVPISAIFDWPQGLRPAQLCAMSAWEMRDALDYTIAQQASTFTVVSHSFELLSRDRERRQRSVVGRFEALIELFVARRDAALTSGFADLDLSANDDDHAPQPANALRTIHRMGAQLLSRRDELRL